MSEQGQASERAGDLINLRSMTSEQFAVLNDSNIPTTPNSFRHSGAAAPLTLKEQEKLMDEMKKENFDLKLRVYHLEDRLRQLAPSNVDAALRENVELRVQNEALLAEIRAHQEVISEAQTAIEQYRQQSAARGGTEAEMGRLRQEVEMAAGQLQKTQALCARYEAQLALFDKESRETVQKMKQAEAENSGLAKRLADAQHQVAALEEEQRGLEEEVQRKNGLVHQFKLDASGMAQELELITRQMGELQAALRAAQDEREQLLRERETVRRAPAAAVAASPRSSLDLLESKLMRELTQATRRLQDLEKQTEAGQSEKAQLVSQSKSLVTSIEQATAAIRHLGAKLCGPLAAGVRFAEAASFPEVFEQVERVADQLLREHDECQQARACAAEVAAKHEAQLAGAHGERQRLEQELARAQQCLEDGGAALAAKEQELGRLHEAAAELQRKAAAAYEAELPRLREELAALRDEARRARGAADAAAAEAERAQQAAREFREKWEEAQSIAIQASSESSDRLAHIAQLQQSRAELVKKLAAAEELAQTLNRRAEEARGQLEHAEKVKQAVEEGFNRQIKALHATTAELKLQLATNSSGASDAAARVERLNVAMEALRGEKEALLNKLQAKEHSIGALQQELESGRMDRRRLETDLVLREDQLRKAEHEMARLRKDDARKSSEGASHLQAKIESLGALNTFLRDQADQKDRHLRDMEERLRLKDAEMVQTREEVDQQSKRLKKREQLIAQALKRLETINQLTGGAAPGALAGDAVLGTHGLAPHAEDLTPIRPTKLPFRPADKENEYRRANFEF